MTPKELRARLREIILQVPGVAGFHGGLVIHRGGLRVKTAKSGGVSFRADLALDSGYGAADVGEAIEEAVEEGLKAWASVPLVRSDIRFTQLRTKIS
ncbi:MAG: hypothetical protein GC168_15855 [Candidatus Hydrogenedens sp.]|nr:hypothetical protein [Candidatus Hydrogenedens sp.]